MHPSHPNKILICLPVTIAMVPPGVSHRASPAVTTARFHPHQEGGAKFQNLMPWPAGGAWGTALAMHAARMGHDTLLYAREPQVSKDINDPAVKENTLYLKVLLPSLLVQRKDL